MLKGNSSARIGPYAVMYLVTDPTSTEIFLLLLQQASEWRCICQEQHAPLSLLLTAHTGLGTPNCMLIKNLM